MTDPRDPIREALSRAAMYGVDSGSAEENRRWGKQAVEALAALDSLRVVQPGEVVLSAEDYHEVLTSLHVLETGSENPWVEAEVRGIRALLASGPDREAEA